MKILGISAYAHDSAACLVEDGRLVALCEQERHDRVKHSGAFPAQAIEECLTIAGCAPSRIDHVAFFLRPDLMRERCLAVARDHFPRSLFAFAPMMHGLRRIRRRLPRDLRRAGLGAPLRFVEHHLAHAVSAFSHSPFDEAALLTIDGKGEWASTTMGYGRGRRVTLCREIRYPHSLGYLYSVFTKYLGFKPWGGEGKVMGLAPYGTPRHLPFLRSLAQALDDGGLRLDLSRFRFHLGLPWVHPAIERALGPAREPESEITERHADIAASLQARTDELVLHFARHLRQRTGLDAICLAGGVALNSTSNGKLVESGLFKRHFFHPAAYDAGAALGAALAVWHHDQGGPRVETLESAAFGDEFDEAALRDAAARSGMPCTKPLDLEDEVAMRLQRGEIVGWFHGRAEFGPRALGQRSILADPRDPGMKDRVNQRVKFREAFRPFAPSVPVERAAEFFELSEPAPFMLVVVPVRAEKRALIPAVTHVDGSARVQTVDARILPRFHRLLVRFGDRSGVPVLLNTSFNRRGEPVVRTPDQAIAMFRDTAMDALAMPPLLVTKTPTPQAIKGHGASAGDENQA